MSQKARKGFIEKRSFDGKNARTLRSAVMNLTPEKPVKTVHRILVDVLTKSIYFNEYAESPFIDSFQKMSYFGCDSQLLGLNDKSPHYPLSISYFNDSIYQLSFASSGNIIRRCTLNESLNCENITKARAKRSVIKSKTIVRRHD